MNKSYEIDLVVCSNPEQKIRITSLGKEDSYTILQSSIITCPLSKRCMNKLHVEKDHPPPNTSKYVITTDQPLSTFTTQLRNCIEQESDDSDSQHTSLVTSSSRISTTSHKQHSTLHNQHSTSHKQQLQDQHAVSSNAKNKQRIRSRGGRIRSRGDEDDGDDDNNNALVLLSCISIFGMLAFGAYKIKALQEKLKLKKNRLKHQPS